MKPHPTGAFSSCNLFCFVVFCFLWIRQNEVDNFLRQFVIWHYWQKQFIWFESLELQHAWWLELPVINYKKVGKQYHRNINCTLVLFNIKLLTVVECRVWEQARAFNECYNLFYYYYFFTRIFCVRLSKQQKINRPFSWWSQITTTIKIHYFFVLF